jgi:CRP-like cAMP-binding protein
VTVALLRPGDAFGYLACWLDEGCSATAWALTASEVVGVPVQAFCAFVAAQPAASDAVLRALSARLAALERLRALSTEPARARVRSVLRFLCEVTGPRIPMTRPMIATVAGLTTETVSRALAPLSRRRAIALRRGAVEVLDASALEDGR